MSSPLYELSPSLRAYAEAVIDAQIIPRNELENWLTGFIEAKHTLYDLAEQLPQSGLVSEFLLARDLAQFLNIPYMGDLELELYGSAHPALSRKTCIEYGVLCVSDGPRDPLPMVVTNPLDQEVLRYISELVGAELELHLASPQDLYREIDHCYGFGEEQESTILMESGSLPVSTADALAVSTSVSDEIQEPNSLRLTVSLEQSILEKKRIDAFLDLLSGDSSF